MVHYCKQLYAELQAALEDNGRQQLPSLQKSEQAIQLCNDKLKKLKDYIIGFEFQDVGEQVTFFKEIKPLFLQDLIFAQKLYEIEAAKPVGTAETLALHYREQLGYLIPFFESNPFLHQYYLTEKTFMDHMLFIRSPEQVPMLPPEYQLDADDRFSNIYSYKFAKFQAYEALANHLSGLITAIEKGETAIAPSEFDKLAKVYWKGKKADFYETVLGWVEGGFITGDIKTAMGYLGFCLGIQPGNYYAYFQAMRIRKKNRTPALQKMIDSIIYRWDQQDEFPAANHK